MLPDFEVRVWRPARDLVEAVLAVDDQGGSAPSSASTSAILGPDRATATPISWRRRRPGWSAGRGC